MNNKLPCEVVRDLFPSYIDGLTSDTTNKVVEEHIAECEPCKNILQAMKEPAAQSMSLEEKKEVDFLKKNRKKNRLIIWGSLLLAVLVVSMVLFVRTFFVGRQAFDGMMAWEVNVDGNQLTMDVMLGQKNSVSSIDYEEESGIVKVSVEYVQRSIFNRKNDIQSVYVADKSIQQVWMGDRIIWSQGEKISEMTAEVYNTAHAYVGDMPANFKTVVALDMTYYLGPFKNELQTSVEPYGWKICLEESVTGKERANKEQLMQAYACVLLAVIDNLGQVTYEYMVDGEVLELTVDISDATKLAGVEIKECGKEIALLERFIRENNLN